VKLAFDSLTSLKVLLLGIIFGETNFMKSLRLIEPVTLIA